MIEIKHLNKFFNKGKSNEIHVINDVSLSLPDTGMVALFGKSGCGKTTLLNVIGGLDNFASGALYINNKKVSNKNVDSIRNNHIGYIFQNYCLNTKETVLENVMDALYIAGEKNKQEITDKAMKALASVSMDKYARRNASELSGGQQQRVAIARAIVKGPDIILADEPTGNLDNENTILVMNILKAISKNRLVLIVTHEEDIVKNYCDQIIQIVDGEIKSNKENLIDSNISYTSNNVIYLDELNSHTFEEQGLTIKYYGDVLEKTSSLLIISKDGKLYIKPQSNNIQLLNEDEIKILDKKPIISEEEKNMSVIIDNFEKNHSKKKGHLYKFKKSFIDGLKFTIGKKQKGQKAMRMLFVLFTIAVVFISASLGSKYYKSKESTKDLNPNMIYLSEINHAYNNASQYDLYKIYDAIKNNPNNYGKYSTTFSSYNISQPESFQFIFGDFESASSKLYIDFKATRLPLYLIENKSLMLGNKPTKDYEVVITTEVADSILLNSNYSFIKNYKDLINYRITVPYYNYFNSNSNINLKIVGIYRSSIKEIYLSNYAITQINLINTNLTAYINGIYNTVQIVRKTDIPSLKNTQIDKGHCIVYKNNTSEFDKNELSIKYNNDYLENKYEVDDVIEDTNLIYSLVVLNDNDFLEYMNMPPVVTDYKSDYIAIYEPSSEKREEIISKIKNKYSNIHIDTFDTLAAEINNNTSADLLSSYLGLITIIAILSICIFFIMRTSLFSRIKEIGIARAIGVNNNNIVFKFFVESLAIVVLVIFVAHLATSIFIWKLMSLSTTIFTLLYYPVWLYFFSFVLLTGITSLAAILPVILLLRKTPAQILSKYDI